MPETWWTFREILLMKTFKTNEWGLCFLHAFFIFLLPDLFSGVWIIRLEGRRSFHINRGRGYFCMICSWPIVIPDYAHPQLTHFNKEGWFLQWPLYVLDDCPLPTLRIFFDLGANYSDVYLWSAVIKTEMTSFYPTICYRSLFVLNLYSSRFFAKTTFGHLFQTEDRSRNSIFQFKFDFVDRE